MPAKPLPRISVADIPARRDEMRQTLATGQPLTLTGAAPPEASVFLAFLASPQGREMIARFQAPDLASKPMLQMDRKTTQRVVRALSDVATPDPAVPKRRPAAAKRPPAAAEAPAIRRPAYDETPASWPRHTSAASAVTEPVTMMIGGKPYRAPPLVVRPVAAAPRRAPDTKTALGPHETVVIGATGGMLLGAGAAHICNALRHIDPTGIGSILFAVAGAVAGAGAGTLIGAKLIKPADVTTPALKLGLAVP